MREESFSRDSFEGRPPRSDRGERGERGERSSRERSDRGDRNDRGDRGERPARQPRSRDENVADVPMQTYRLEVGRDDGVKPGNIVGAIANEANISSQHIHNIRINDGYTTVELPAGMPTALLTKLRAVWVCQKQLSITVMADGYIADAAPKAFKKPRMDDDSKPATAGRKRSGPPSDKPSDKPRKKKTS
ncbi:MAG: DbpA RNA binding domain-containing protein [Marinagarivorans sp.]|nr:DbpA RNA binding domain-containing protein [Marinagarivorans sp.]